MLQNLSYKNKQLVHLHINSDIPDLLKCGHLFKWTLIQGPKPLFIE